MKNLLTHFFCFLLPISLVSQNETVNYTLNHSPNSGIIEIAIELPPVSTNTAMFVIPRSGPGTYDLTNYLPFYDNVKGYTESGKALAGTVGRGSFFIFQEEDELLNRVTYEVDIKKMENDLLGGFASSKVRSNYLGILGYSVFGFVDGLQDNPIKLDINTGDQWPIFSTLAPSVRRNKGQASYSAENYATLVDAQYLLGSMVQVYQVRNAPIPFFVAAYSETSISMSEIGRRGLLALNGLAEYFGYIPMPHYTMCYEFIKPYSPRHDYGFSMEHLNSMTASLSVSDAITEYEVNARIGSIVHHIGHSWVPLRSYGTGYRPFEWHTAPLIETIWLNEGFTWYVATYSVLKNEAILERFKNTVENAPDYIQRKSLKELSLLGSTQYSLDFNIGQNLFSRGALLARDLDVYIQQRTNGQKSFKDVMLGLLRWTEANQRAFEYDEIESIISNSVGVDISDIWTKWQEPIKK